MHHASARTRTDTGACRQRNSERSSGASPCTTGATRSLKMRGEFTIAAGKLDTWNAVGQIVVRTHDARYAGRSQMLDLYSVRYRDQPFLLVTRALLLSDTVKDTTTLVTARTVEGKPIDSDASAELLGLLQRELPAEIERVRATQSAQAAARAAKAKKPKPKARKRK